MECNLLRTFPSLIQQKRHLRRNDSFTTLLIFHITLVISWKVPFIFCSRNIDDKFFFFVRNFLLFVFALRRSSFREKTIFFLNPRNLKPLFTFRTILGQTIFVRGFHPPGKLKYELMLYGNQTEITEKLIIPLLYCREKKRR